MQWPISKRAERFKTRHDHTPIVSPELTPNASSHGGTALMRVGDEDTGYVPATALLMRASVRYDGPFDDAEDEDAVKGRTMRPSLAPLISIASGILLGTQQGVNIMLRQRVLPSDNGIVTSLVSFTVSTLCLLPLALPNQLGDACSSRGQYVRCDPWGFATAPWYGYLGGISGALYVIGTIVVAERLGFAAFAMMATLGQVSTSLACDVTGLLQDVRRVPSCVRVLALSGVVVGAVLAIDGVALDDRGGTGASDGRWTAFLLTGSFVSGCGMPLQALLNGAMTRHMGSPFRASVISFAGGTLLLTVLAGAFLARGDPVPSAPLATVGSNDIIEPAPPWLWMGGALGAIAITGNMLGVGAIGAAAYSAILVPTQLAIGLCFDLVGAFGLPALAPSPMRLVGVLLAAACAVAYQLAPWRAVPLDSRELL